MVKKEKKMERREIRKRIFFPARRTILQALRNIADMNVTRFFISKHEYKTNTLESSYRFKIMSGFLMSIVSDLWALNHMLMEQQKRPNIRVCEEIYQMFLEVTSYFRRQVRRSMSAIDDIELLENSAMTVIEIHDLMIEADEMGLLVDWNYPVFNLVRVMQEIKKQYNRYFELNGECEKKIHNRDKRRNAKELYDMQTSISRKSSRKPARKSSRKSSRKRK